MTSFIIPHLLFLLLLALTPPLLADDNLIKQQCHNADAPELCVQCVKSDSIRARKADKVGIAAILIHCLSNHSLSLARNMSDLANTAPTKNLTSAYQSCCRGYHKANKYLSKVVSCLKCRDFDQANYSVRAALEFQLTCRGVFESFNWPFPIDVDYEMRVYEALSVSAMRIIDRF